MLRRRAPRTMPDRLHATATARRRTARPQSGGEGGLPRSAEIHIQNPRSTPQVAYSTTPQT
eukprot:scaffold94116_cov30-Tisochrysis_lutea.AAC.1